MIIFLVFVAIMPFSLAFKNSNITFAAQKESIYAKVENDGVYLYSNPKIDNESKLFQLPNSYFVRLIENAGEDFYYCVYKDVYGYVKKSDVTAMKGTPIMPFVEANFRVYAPEGLGLYSKPQLSEQLKKATIPYLTDTITYYGTIVGQEAIPDKSNVWIYCKFSYETNAYGYVYSVFCDKLPTITTNTERFEVIEVPFEIASKGAKELTSVAMGFIIVGVSLPCLIVLFLLVKPSMQKVNNPKTKLKGRRNKDYFEFDENDLT